MGKNKGRFESERERELQMRNAGIKKHNECDWSRDQH